MKRSHWVLVLISALVTLMVAPTASAESPGKSEVCHATASDSPEWRLIDVSVKSLDQHLGHGDGLPGEVIPGSEGDLAFDESCGVVSVEASDPGDPGNPGDPGDPGDGESVFAVAYSDLDEDGAYEPTEDVLIAKLVDGPGAAANGLPGAGDVIVTDQYPTDRDLVSFGSFGVTEHVVTGVTPTATRCLVSTTAGTFTWDDSATVENYEERSTAGVYSIFKDSVAAGGSDVISAITASPSAPATFVEIGVFDGVDQPFLEVELNCSS